eukprot:scaffold721_cov131-Cylindrotheca_fusiformis.AAC.53
MNRFSQSIKTKPWCWCWARCREPLFWSKRDWIHGSRMRRTDSDALEEGEGGELILQAQSNKKSYISLLGSSSDKLTPKLNHPIPEHERTFASVYST